MRYTKENGSNGITLIALVVTIVVLLILAGVVIVSTVQPNSVMNKANDANIEDLFGKSKEEIMVDTMDKITEISKESVDNIGDNVFEYLSKDNNINKMVQNINDKLEATINKNEIENTDVIAEINLLYKNGDKTIKGYLYKNGSITWGNIVQKTNEVKEEQVSYNFNIR